VLLCNTSTKSLYGECERPVALVTGFLFLPAGQTSIFYLEAATHRKDVNLVSLLTFEEGVSFTKTSSEKKLQEEHEMTLLNL
jgi:hypothetical protein